MALGNNNISITSVKSETGLSSNKWSGLVGASGLNKYSFYAPGFLSVDGNSDVVLTPPTANMKIGDFRSYNHASLTPSAQANYTQSWGPAGGTVDFTMSWFPQGMNIKEFVVPGDYVTLKFYVSAVDRTNEASVIHTQIFAITFNGITPIPGHTRQTNLRAGSTQSVLITGFPTGGLSVPNCYIYCETYISDISGNRKINLGIRANNYTTITFHQYQYPYVHGYNTNIPTKPPHYTFIIPQVYGTDKCSQSSVNQSLGTNYAFNLCAYALYNDGGGNIFRTMRLPVCYAKLTVDGIDTILMTGGELPDTGQYFSGVLAGGATFNYDDIGVVTFTTGTTVDEFDFVNC